MFLKNIGTPCTDELWRDQGTVMSEPRDVANCPLRIVKVLWDSYKADGDMEPKSVNTNNLLKKGELSARTAV